jgi:hypothetical protein
MQKENLGLFHLIPDVGASMLVCPKIASEETSGDS